MTSRRSLILLLSLLPFGCALFSAPSYDAELDRGATALQAKLNTHFDELQRTAGTPEGAWEHHAPFYESVRADLTILFQHAGAQPGNDTTVRSLELLATNVAEVEAVHRAGLSPREVPILKQLLDMQLRMLTKLEQAKKRSAREAA